MAVARVRGVFLSVARGSMGCRRCERRNVAAGPKPRPRMWRGWQGKRPPKSDPRLNPTQDLNPTQEKQHDHDYQDDADDPHAAVTVAVAVATEATTEAAKEEDDKEDDEDESEHDLSPVAEPD